MRRAASILAAVTVAGVLLASPAHAATTSPPDAVAVVLSAPNLDSVVATPSFAPQTGTYVVQRGDTLTRIAGRYCGNPSAYRSIGAASGIGNFDLIYPGQRLTLKCTGGVRATHAVPNPIHAVPTLHAQTASVAVSGTASRAVSFALAQVGKPYIWGATGPGGFDCSGIVVAAYARLGINLPHQSDQLMRVGRPVSRANLQPGDVIQPYVGHVMIYIGGGRVVEAANPRQGVRISSVYAFRQARRYA